MDEKPTFNVAIIYEDSAAGRRAKHFYDKVIRELVDECNFSLELWNFQVLAIPRTGNPESFCSQEVSIKIGERRKFSPEEAQQEAGKPIWRD
jgi:hypothetical protein